jgi:Protein of unknown function (DUF2958)
MAETRLDEKTLTRLGDLFAMMGSPNRQEAERAREAADRLLAKFGKSMTDLAEIVRSAAKGNASAGPASDYPSPDSYAQPSRPATDGVLITPEQRTQLLANSEASRKAGKRLDHRPVVKLVGKYLGQVWLTEMSANDRDVVYGLVADVSNTPEVVVGQFRVSDVIADMKPVRDTAFTADRPLSAYEAEERAEQAQMDADNEAMFREFEEEDRQARADAARARRDANGHGGAKPPGDIKAARDAIRETLKVRAREQATKRGATPQGRFDF